MAAGKEIRGKIKSFENTKKITKAMEMVSVAKMRKAQDRMRAARPYAEKVRCISAGRRSREHGTFCLANVMCDDYVDPGAQVRVWRGEACIEWTSLLKVQFQR